MYYQDQNHERDLLGSLTLGNVSLSTFPRVGKLLEWSYLDHW